MQKLEDYLDERRHDQIIEEILDLKVSGKKDSATKLRIQKLQQELDAIEHRLKL
jgi:hypothetical protein